MNASPPFLSFPCRPRFSSRNFHPLRIHFQAHFLFLFFFSLISFPSISRNNYIFSLRKHFFLPHPHPHRRIVYTSYLRRFHSKEREPSKFASQINSTRPFRFSGILKTRGPENAPSRILGNNSGFSVYLISLIGNWECIR